MLGWMNNWQYAGKEPTETWSGAGTLPRELGLVKDRSTYLLTSTPIKEIENIRGQSVHLKQLSIKDLLVISDSISFPASPLEMQLTFDNFQTDKTDAKPEKYGVRLRNNKGEYIAVGYDTVEKRFYIDRTNATGTTFSDKFAGMHNMPYESDEPVVDWHIFIDNSSIELFAAGNRVVMTDVFYPSRPFDTIEVFTQNGTVGLIDAKLIELNSIWR